VGLRARLTLTNQRRRIDKNRTRRLPARYSLTPGAIFDQVRSNNRTSPINRTRNTRQRDGLKRSGNCLGIEVI
jgi:hypothetical protein